MIDRGASTRKTGLGAGSCLSLKNLREKGKKRGKEHPCLCDIISSNLPLLIPNAFVRESVIVLLGEDSIFV